MQPPVTVSGACAGFIRGLQDYTD